MKRSTSNVSFGSVSIHEFGVSLGDNPAAAVGVPIALGKECGKIENIDLHEYEEMRSSTRRPAQFISPMDRREMLKSAGYSNSELAAVKIEVKKIQKSRLKQRNVRPFKDNIIIWRESLFNHFRKKNRAAEKNDDQLQASWNSTSSLSDRSDILPILKK